MKKECCLRFQRVTAEGAERADAAEPGSWLFVLHGIYGAGRNWRSVANRLVGARPDWGVVLVDLRQHGGSTGFPPPHTLEAAAEDIQRLVDAEGHYPRAILGHSFGGKVALVYAREAHPAPEQVWVVDSTPASRPPGGTAWTMLDVLRDHPGPFPDRATARAALEARSLPGAVARWMTTNLDRATDGSYAWRIDPLDMEWLLLDFFETDAWDVVEAPPAGAAIHVVKANESSVLDSEAMERIVLAADANGRVHLHHLEGGHWVNSDNPDGLLRLLSTEL
ncbi:MAG TPA: alpha/beta hydrolase [Longimicrobiales bacterium]|jgi:pimeloyl-ACP methyl ester carboxylesterase